MRPLPLLVSLALVATSSAGAQAAAGHSPDCAAPIAPPADLAGWTDRSPVTAAVDGAGLDRATIPVGRAVVATLHRTREVRFVSMPDRPGGSVSFGGIFAFDVAEAGSYRVALSGGPWIDVLENGTAVLSSAHGRGPACTGIGKMVTFPLQPGRHVLQLSGHAEATLTVLVAKAP